MKLVGHTMDQQWTARNGAIPLSFEDVDDWLEFAGGKGLGVFIGDDACGPFAFLTSRPPETREMPRGPSHGHASDNWRITIRGTTDMGKDAYAEGQFRFQDGGVPYAGDNVAWGPDGGFGMVMFGDRRGFPMRIVKKDHPLQAPADAEAAQAAADVGFEILDPCPGAPAVRTTIGATRKGHLIGGFGNAGSWAEAAPGTRLAAALLGHPEAGPVLVLLRCEPGALAMPGVTPGTETLHVMVDGSCVVGEEKKAIGDFWVGLPGKQPRVIAGPEGLSQVVVFGDRRKLGSFDAAADPAAADWRSAFDAIIDDLRRTVAA